MNQHLSQDDLALFALQVLEDNEMKKALAHLEHCEECRHEVARFQGDLVGYALAQSEWHTPPANARERLVKALSRERKTAARERISGSPAVASSGASRRELGIERASDGDLLLAVHARRTLTSESVEDENHAPRRNGFATFLGWSGWVIAAGVAVAAAMQFHQQHNLQNEIASANSRAERTSASLMAAQDTLQTLTDSGALQVSLHEPIGNRPQPPRPEGHASYIADKGALVFIANHLSPLQPYKTYELWLLQPMENGVSRPPIPAGTFKPDARGVATVIMPELPKGVQAAGFGVTIEDDGGSKIPTAPIVLAGM